MYRHTSVHICVYVVKWICLENTFSKPKCLYLKKTPDSNGMRNIVPIRLRHLSLAPLHSHLTQTCPSRWPLQYGSAANRIVLCLLQQGSKRQGC